METRVLRSRILARLRAGNWVLGAAVLPDAWHIDMLGLLNFDFAWIDAEHSSINDRDLPSLCLAARGAGYDPIVRIVKERASDCYRVLEAGAAAVMVPHCDSVQDAQVAVQNTKFPPLGERSYSGMGVDARYGLLSGRSYMDEANRESLLIVQIETPRAVAAAADIAAIPGVDLLMVGPADLSMNLDAPLELGGIAFRAALAKVAEACERSGKWWGAPVGNQEQAQDMLDMGARFLCIGSPRRVILAGYRALRSDFDALHLAIPPSGARSVLPT